MRIKKYFDGSLASILAFTTYTNVYFRWGSAGFSIVMTSVYSIAALLLVGLYLKINYVMKNFHWYEYERTKKAHRVFLIGSLISLVTQLVFFIYFSAHEHVFDLM